MSRQKETPALAGNRGGKDKHSQSQYTTPNIMQAGLANEVGFVRKWKPHKNSRILISQIQEIMSHLEAEGVTPVKNRTLFYRLGALYGHPKTERFYKSVLNRLLTKMRRADPDCLPEFALNWELLIDEGAVPPASNFYADPDHFWRTIEKEGRQYSTDPLDGQDRRFVIWLEAGGLAAAARQGADEFGVPVATGGRQDSYYMKRKAAEWIAEQEQPVTVFHLGDYDGQGLEIFNNLADDVPALVSEISDTSVDFQRLGVNPEQIEKFSLGTRNPKGTPADIRQGFNDRKGRVLHLSCEAEAFDPVDIRAMVHNAIASRIDVGIFEQTQQRMALERADIQRVITGAIEGARNDLRK